jgi:lipopolysaccharide transport system ATP-binding protein
MSNLAIRVEGLGKQYRIGALQKNGGRGGYKSLRESIANVASMPIRAAGKMLGRGGSDENAATETFWALKDVSFDVMRGEIVGVIGRNGAGKSTLLKVLSRITEPTTGHVEIHGRIGSLLEVGTGFHPELSGRDNIFLNGAILGMKRAEIARQFDEIVAFAEVEKFIDTPVKHYSSGMYLRLAFAVAAHLNPEILVVDEVLAVGDAQFQKKCIEKMDSVSAGGRTVIFVSHNMAAISKLCPRVILLTQGRLTQAGKASAVLNVYLNTESTSSAEVTLSAKDHLASWGGDSSIQLLKIRLLDPEFNTFKVRWRRSIKLELVYEVKRPLREVVLSLAIRSVNDIEIFGCHSDHECPYSLAIGTYSFIVEIQNPLRAGMYYLACGADYPLASAPLFHVSRAATIEVLDVGLDDRTHPQFGAGMIDTEVRWGLPRSVTI